LNENRAALPPHDHPPSRLPPWQWLVVLNLLPPAIACTWVAWLAASYHLYVTKAEYIALGLSVWLIYTIDGLLDARGRQPGEPGSPRRDFHAKHAGWLWFAAFLCFGRLLGHVLSEIGSGLFLSGVFLALVVALYLGHAQALRSIGKTYLPKEIFAGLLFAAGVGLVLMEAHGRGASGPVSMELAGNAFRQGIISGVIWLASSLLFLFHAIFFTEPAIPLFALLCISNCLLTARHEAPGIGDISSAKRVAPALLIVAPIIASGLALSSSVSFFLVNTPELKPIHAGIGLSAALLVVVHLLARQNKFQPATAAFLLDLALLSPVLLFPWNPPV
jgi:hypothetical protein